MTVKHQCSGCCSDLCKRIYATTTVIPKAEFSFRLALMETFPTDVSLGAPSIFSVQSSDFLTFEAFPTLTKIESDSLQSIRFERNPTIPQVPEIKEPPVPDLITP